MKPLIIYIAIFSIFVEYSYSQNYCESYDFLNEMGKIPEFDPEKHSVIAKYCLKYNIGWALLHYEQLIALEIKIQKECSKYSFGATISLEPDRTFFNQIFGGFGNCAPCDFNKLCRGCTKDFVLGYCFDHERDDISYLFDKYIPIKQDLGISCDGEEIPIPMLESSYIYISGICNEEQMKKIEESKKNSPM